MFDAGQWFLLLTSEKNEENAFFCSLALFQIENKHFNFFSFLLRSVNEFVYNIFFLVPEAVLTTRKMSSFQRHRHTHHITF